ncbi:MAG: hypothetical protein BRD44_02130, partial [Bacteroidetes bacterium QS_7_67_15]
MNAFSRAGSLLPLVLVLALTAAPPAHAQQQQQDAANDDGSPLTLEAIHASDAFYPSSFQSG